MTDRRTIELTARITVIDWSTSSASMTRAYSRALLMSEYLRRAAWWARTLDCPDEWPFFDVAGHVDPTRRADPTLVEQVDSALAGRPVWSRIADTCRWALHWSALASSPGVTLPDLDDPFAPLILMYERGGGFTTSTGYLDVDGIGVRRRTLADHLKPDPVVALDTAVLDEMDRFGPPRRSAGA